MGKTEAVGQKSNSQDKKHDVSGQIASSERDYLFDNIKGGLIFLVVLVHLWAAARSAVGKNGAADFIMMAACSFHMPLFMFVSGFFSKHNDRNKLTKLIVIYLFVQGLFFVYDFFVNFHMSLRNYSFIDFLTPGFSMWYLFALIFLKLFLPELSRLRYCIVILALVSILVMGTAMSGPGITAVVKTFANAVYFQLGYVATKDHVKKLRSYPRWIFGIGFGAGMAAMYFITSGLGLVSPGKLRLWMLRARSVQETGLGPVGYIAYALILLGAVYMSAMVIGFMPERKTFLSGIGRNTLTIYIAQAFLYLFYRKLMKTGIIPDMGNASYLIAALLAVICVAVFGSDRMNRAFQFLINKMKCFLLKK